MNKCDKCIKENKEYCSQELAELIRKAIHEYIGKLDSLEKANAISDTFIIMSSYHMHLLIESGAKKKDTLRLFAKLQKETVTKLLDKPKGGSGS